MDYKEIGIIAEQRLALELLEKGYKISKPLVDNYAYDLLLDNGCQVLKIQVKTSSYKRVKSDKSVSYPVLVARGSKSKIAYNKQDIDIVAIRFNSLNIWYFIPIEKLEGKIKIFMFPHVKNSTEKFFEFRDNYSIFDCQGNDIVH